MKVIITESTREVLFLQTDWCQQLRMATTAPPPLPQRHSRRLRGQKPLSLSRSQVEEEWPGASPTPMPSTDNDQYCVMISKHLLSFLQDIFNCSIHDYSVHHKVLDSYTHSLISVLDSCSRLCFPSYTHISASPRLPGWNDSTDKLREISAFWHRVWLRLAVLQLVYFST